ncbi:MAG: SpoIID/LytB domain-containing protein [Bdellovibrionota bacterium]
MFLISQAAGAFPAHMATSSRIRVRLDEAAPKVTVRGYDLSLRESRFDRSVFHADRTTSWELHCQNGRIRALATAGGRALDLQEPVTIASAAGFVNVRGQPYRDEIRVWSVGSLCEVVNEIDIEKYLEGIVNNEFSTKWSEQAIAAQVIAARTYAAYQMRKVRADSPGAHFDVDSSVKDQVYDGSQKEDARGARSVASTRGMVLTVGGAKDPVPMKAFYHSTCGGLTELPENVWGVHYPGFKHPVVCRFCASSPRFTWNLDFSARELADQLMSGARASGPPRGWPATWMEDLQRGRLQDIRVSRKDVGGRVTEVATLWEVPENGRARRVVELTLSGSRLREWLGATRVRSTAFTVSPRWSILGSRWRLDGKGNGHGVGMCQWGAKIMGDQGYKTADILKYYYPDAAIRKLW